MLISEKRLRGHRQWLSDEQIIEIYEGLQKGYRYVPEQMKNGDTFYGIELSRTTGYIHWRNHGSSAEENTVEDLAWLLSVIFDDTTGFKVYEVIRPEYRGGEITYRRIK